MKIRRAGLAHTDWSMPVISALGRCAVGRYEFRTRLRPCPFQKKERKPGGITVHAVIPEERRAKHLNLRSYLIPKTSPTECELQNEQRKLVVRLRLESQHWGGRDRLKWETHQPEQSGQARVRCELLGSFFGNISKVFLWPPQAPTLHKGP